MEHSKYAAIINPYKSVLKRSLKNLVYDGYKLRLFKDAINLKTYYLLLRYESSFQ